MSKLKTHDFVIFQENADRIIDGRKKTVRYGGFNGFHDGDLIYFHCIDSDMMFVDHPINKRAYKITGFMRINSWTIDIYVEPYHVSSDVNMA